MTVLLGRLVVVRWLAWSRRRSAEPTWIEEFLCCANTISNDLVAELLVIHLCIGGGIQMVGLWQQRGMIFEMEELWSSTAALPSRRVCILSVFGFNLDHVIHLISSSPPSCSLRVIGLSPLGHVSGKDRLVELSLLFA
jgi:hypothetical protein